MSLLNLKLVPLPTSFYEPSAEAVAPALLGHWLLRRTESGWVGGPIVETEAYLADDPACHGYGGKTARNRTMYGPPGFAYVYLIYGFHFCVNAVCRPSGHAEAVLIRAIEAEFGEEQLRRNRPVTKTAALTSGPGKLCSALNIDRTLDGAPLWTMESSVIIAANPTLEPFRKSRGPIAVTPRIGITRAADAPLRFYLKGSEFVSKRSRISPPSSSAPV